MPNLKGLFLAAVCTAATGFNITAAERLVQQLSLQDCINLALQHNLNLQIERRNPTRASYDITAAQGNYYDPDLSFGAQTSSRVNALTLDSDNRLVPSSTSDSDNFNAGLSGTLPGMGTTYNIRANTGKTTGDNLSGSFTNANGGSAIIITQPVLKNFWIDGGRLNIAQSRFNLEKAELGLKRQVMSIITQVERAYYDLIYSYENVQVQEKSLQLAQRSLEETQKRFEVGTVAELETKQTASQVAAREADLLTARRNLELQQNTLRRLISDNFAAIHGTQLSPTETLEAPVRVFDVQLSWDKGLSDRPDLNQARIDMESMGLTLKYNRNQLFPQLDLQGSYGLNGSSLNGYQGVFDNVSNRDLPNWFVGGVFSVPLGNRAARSRYRSSQVQEEQLLLTLKNLEQGIMVEIDDAIKTAASSYDRVQATRKAREYAEAALDAEQKRLENGKSTAFFVLSLQNDLTAARLSWIRSIADYNNALAELSYREASTLTRHEITWDDSKMNRE